MIYLNRNAPHIIATCATSIRIVLPERRVGFIRRGNCIRVSSYSGAWPQLLPQHGAGKKHERRIDLMPWQRGLVRSYPGHFVRGCIHSDGCRHRRIVNDRNYPAYSFKNRSEDILGLFMWACAFVELRPRRANTETISIARRSDVARLDALFGYTADSQSVVERGDRAAEQEVGDAEDLVGNGLEGAAGAPPAGGIGGLVAGDADDRGDLALEA